MSAAAPVFVAGYQGPGQVRAERSARRVRVLFGGVAVADSSRTLLVLERGHMPVYYFPRDDVAMHHLEASERSSHCPHKGDARYWSVAAGGKSAEDAAWEYPQPLPGAPDLRDHVAFYWKRMDAWFEEDEEVFVHPRDPYKRIDAIRSSRRIEIVVAGETVAESSRPTLLFETGLPTRYYLPRWDVRMERFVASDTRSQCPYKGVASYLSYVHGEARAEDIAWRYDFPVPECPKIEGLVCFFDERVDAVVLDGHEQPRPQTPWSNPK